MSRIRSELKFYIIFLEIGEKMAVILDYLIILWGFLLIGIMAIGGFFMFRKFLKQLPKADGKSDMDWERYYLEKTLHMWEEEEKELLEKLLSPVPKLFRDVAKQTIASKVGELALKENKDKITRELLIKGYIIGTPKRDHRFLRRKLKEEKIDVAPYEHLFTMSKDDYDVGWEEKYRQRES